MSNGFIRDLSALNEFCEWLNKTKRGGRKMFTQFYNKTLFSKVIAIIVIAGFVLSSVPVSYANTDALRPEAAKQNPIGGKSQAGSPRTTNKNFELLSNIPEAVKALANRDLRGQYILIRVNMNVKSKDGVLDDTARIDAIAPIAKFLLNKGATPIFFGHNGRLDQKKGKDERQSLEDVAAYIQNKLFPDIKVKFHEDSIPKDKGKGLQLTKSDIVPGVINILENVRFADEYEVGPKRMIFAKSLIALSDGIFIFDAFGDVNSNGASVETVPFLAKEVYTGPAMVEEFNTLKGIMTEGFDALIFGGAKLEKTDLLDRLVNVIRPGGFVLIGSGPTPLLSNEKKDFLAKLQGNPDREVIIALDYRDKTTLDIGPQTTKKYLEKLDTLKVGQRVIINGTMGFMEGDPQYQQGTKEINEKLIELARRGVIIIVIGGDASNWANKYGLAKEKNVILFTGGGVPLNILAEEPLVGLKALNRRQKQIESAHAVTPKMFNIVINGARGRMGMLYLHKLLHNEKFSSRMRVVALNGIPLGDLDDFMHKLTSPDSTYGMLFPGAEAKIVQVNKTGKYAIIEINGQRILVLNDREDAIRWDLAGEIFGEEFLTRSGIIESSGQDLESAKSMKRHIVSAGDAIVEFGAPPKDEGTPIVVLGVNDEELSRNAQVFSNASCTTNCIAQVAKLLHERFGVKRAVLLTDHAETSDQSATDTFRGDEPARARPGHKVQSPAKTGAAKLLPKLIPGIGPNDGKAIRVGTLTASVVIYSAELEKPATVEELRELFIQAARDNPNILGVGYNLSSRDIVKDPHSAIVDLALIKVSPDGKRVLVPSWYDNEWGYAERGLDTMLATLIMQEEGKRTRDFAAPAKAVKEAKEIKVVPVSELEGLTSEGALPVFIPASKAPTGKVTDIYLTGIKEKQASRNGQITLRMLLGDPRFNIKAITVDGITKDDFEPVMKAFAQSIIYSADLGNLEGIKITPVLTDKDDMYLVFGAAGKKRSVRVLPSLPADIEAGAKVLDITKIKYSFAEMINLVRDSLKPLNAELVSAIISMSTKPGGELLDSGKGISIPANILPTKIPELDSTGILYQAYQVPVNSGSYLVATFSIKGIVDKDAINKLIKTIPGIGVENDTSSHFVSNRVDIVYDKAHALIMPDKKEGVTIVSLFFLVNEELNAVNKVLEEIAFSASSAAGTTAMQIKADLIAQQAPAPGEAQVSFKPGSIAKGTPDAQFSMGIPPIQPHDVTATVPLGVNQIAQAIGVDAEKLNGFIKADQAVYKALGGSIFDGYINALKVSLEDEKPRALAVSTSFFKAGGVDTALTKIAQLSKVIKIALYGENAEKFKILLGNNEVITARTAEDLVKELANCGIAPADIMALGSVQDEALAKMQVRQVIAKDMGPVAVAKALKELLGTGSAIYAFSLFYVQLRDVGALSPEAYAETRESMLAKLEEGIFELPNVVKPTQNVSEQIAADASVVSEFIDQV